MDGHRITLLAAAPRRFQVSAGSAIFVAIQQETGMEHHMDTKSDAMRYEQGVAL
jgi:hypothetical protein